MQAENEPALPVKTVVVDAEHYAKLGKAVKTLHHNLSIRTAQVADLKRQNAELKDQCNQLLEACKPASDAGVLSLGGQFIVMRAPAPQTDQLGSQGNSLSQLRSASGGGGAPQTLTALGALSLRRSTSLARRSAVGSRVQGSTALAVPSAAISRRQPAALSSRPSSQGTRPTVSSVGDDLCSLPSGASTPGRCTAEAIPDVSTGCAALATQHLPVCRVDAPAPPSSGDRTNKLGSRIRAMLSLGSAKRKDQASPHPMTSPRAAQDPQHQAELGSPGLGPLGRNLARMRSQREQQHQHHQQQPPRDYQLPQFQSHPQPLHPVPSTDMQQPDAVTAGTSQHTGLSLQRAPDGAVPVAIQAQVEAMVHKYVTQALHTSPQLLAALTCSKPDPVHMVLGQPTSMASEGEGALERGPMFMGKSQSMTGRTGLQGSFRGSRYGLPHSKPDSGTICADAQPLHANLATTSTPGAAHKPAGAGVQFGTPPRRCEPYPAALTVGATTAEVWQPPDRLSWGSELPAAPPLMTAGSTGSASATQLPVPDPAVPLVSRSSAPTAATRQLAASLRASKATDPHLEVILSQLLTPNAAVGQAGSVSLGPASAPILSHSKPTATQPELLQGSYQPVIPWPAGQAAVQPVYHRPAQADLDSDEVNVGEITVRTSLVQQFLQQCAAQQAADGLADPACSLPEGAGPPAQSALPHQVPEPASVLGHGRATDTAAPPAVPAQRADMSLTDSLVMFEETLRASHALALAADLHAAGQAADALHASVPTQHIQPPPSSPPNSPPTLSSCSTAAAASFSLAPHINARAQHPAPSSTTAADSPAESQGSSSSAGGRAAASVCGPSTVFQPPAQPGADYSHCSAARDPLPASAAASPAAAPPCELPKSPALHSGPWGCSQTPASNRRQRHHSSPVAAASPQLVVSPGCAIPAPMPSCSPRCARTPKKGSADPAPLSPAALSRQTDSFSSTRSGSLWSGLDHAAQQGSQATAACTDVGGADPLPDLCPGSDVSPSASPPACTPEALAVVQGAGRAGRAATAEGYRVHSAGIPSASQAGPRQPVLRLAGTIIDDGEAVCGSEEEGYCYNDDDDEGVGLVPPHSNQSPRASLLAISPTSSGSWEELYCSPAQQQPEPDLLHDDQTCHSPATSCSPCPALPPVVTTPECISGQGSPAGLGWSSGDDGEGCAEDEMDAGLSAEEQHQLQSLTVSIGRARLQAVAGSQPGSVHASHSTSIGSRSSQEVLVGGETASSVINMPLQRTAATAVREGPEVQPGAQHTCTAGPDVAVACELAGGLDSHLAQPSGVGTASLAAMAPGEAESEQPSGTPAAAAPAPVPQASTSTPKAIAAVAADGPAAPPSPTVCLEASQGACIVQLLGTTAMHSDGEGQECCVEEAVAPEPGEKATSLPDAVLRSDQAVPTAAATPPEQAVQPAPAALSQQAELPAPAALPAQAAPGTRPKASALAFWKQREQAAAVQPTAGPIQGSTAPVRKLNVERLLPIAAATSASAAAHAATAFTATKPAAAAVTKPASASAAKQSGTAVTKVKATAFSKPAATAKAFAWRPAPGSGAQPVSQADVIAAKDQAAGAQPQDAEHGSTSAPVPVLTSKPQESSPSNDPHDQVEEDPGCQVGSRQPVAPALPVLHQAGPTDHQPAVLTAHEPSDQPMPATAAAELQPTNNEPAVAHTVAAEQATALHSQAVHTTTVASCSHADPPACPVPSTAYGQTTHQCASESAECKQADGSPCSIPFAAAVSSSPCLSQGTSVTPLHANRPRRSSSSQLNSMMRSMTVFDVAAEGSSGAEAAEEVTVPQPVPPAALATAAAKSLELTSPSVASASVLQPQQEEAQEEQQHSREQDQEEQQQPEEKGGLEEEQLREQEQQQAQQREQEEQQAQHEEEREEEGEEEEQQQPSLIEPGCPPDHPPTAWVPSQPDDSMAPASICSSPAQSQQGQPGSDSLSLSSLAVSLQAHSAAQDHGPLPAQPHHLSSGGLGVLLVHHNMLYSLKDAEQHTSACSSAQASVTCLDLRPKGHAPGPQHLSAGRHIGGVAGCQEPAVVPNTTALHSPVLDSNHLRKSRFAAGPPPAAPAAPADAVSQPVSSTCASQPGDNNEAMEEAQPFLQLETGAEAASSGASSPSCQLDTVSDLQGIRSPPRGILRLAADLELTQQGDGLYGYDSGDEGDGDVRVGGSMDSQQDEVHSSPGTPDSLTALSASYRTGHSSGSNQADSSPVAGSCSCSVQMFRQARGSGARELLDSQLGEARLSGSAGGAFLLPSPEEQQPPLTPGLQRQANVPRLSMSSSASKQACSSLTLKPCPASPTAATPALVCRPPAMQRPGHCAAAAAAAAAAACVLSTPGDSSAATAEAGCQRSGDFRLSGGVEDTAVEAATPPCVPHGLTAILSRPACSSGCLPGLNTSGSRTHRRHSGLCSGGRPVSSGRGQGSGLIHSAVRSTGANSSGLGYSDTTTGCSGGESSCSAKKRPRELVALPFTSLEQLEAGEGAPEWSDLEGEHSSSISSTSGLHSPGCDSHDGHGASSTRAPHAPHHDATGSRSGPHGQASSTTPTSAAPLTKRRLVEAGRGGRAATAAKRPIPHAAASALSHLRTWGQALSQSSTKVQHPGAAGVSSAAQQDVSVSAANLPAPGAGHRRTASTKQGGATGQVACEPAPSHSPRRMWRWGGVGGSAAKKALANEDRGLQSRGGPGPANSQVLGPSTLPVVPQWQQASAQAAFQLGPLRGHLQAGTDCEAPAAAASFTSQGTPHPPTTHLILKDQPGALSSVHPKPFVFKFSEDHLPDRLAGSVGPLHHLQQSKVLAAQAGVDGVGLPAAAASPSKPPAPGVRVALGAAPATTLRSLAAGVGPLSAARHHAGLHIAPIIALPSLKAPQVGMGPPEHNHSPVSASIDDAGHGAGGWAGEALAQKLLQEEDVGVLFGSLCVDAA